MEKANDRVVFYELVSYIKQQLTWKKQSVYKHGLPLLKEVCERIAEDFNNAVEFAAPNAKSYRDVYTEIFE